MRSIGRVVWMVVIAVFFGMLLSCVVTLGVWPGEVKLLAPVFCDADLPDPVVVVDSYNTRPGETSYSYSLYCVGPRGNFDEIGWMRPFLGIMLVHSGLMFLPTLWLFGKLRRLRFGRVSAAQAVLDGL